MEFVTRITFPRELKARVEKIASDIAVRDSSFVYTTKESKTSAEVYDLIILSGSFDRAHKRGLLLVKKYLEDVKPPLRYKVSQRLDWPFYRIQSLTATLQFFEDPLYIATLAAINSQGTADVKAISQGTSLQNDAISNILQDLQKAGLIAKRDSEYFVTEQGKNILDYLNIQLKHSGK